MDGSTYLIPGKIQELLQYELPQNLPPRGILVKVKRLDLPILTEQAAAQALFLTMPCFSPE